MGRRLKRLENLSDEHRPLTRTIGGHPETSDYSFEVVNPSTALPWSPDAYHCFQEGRWPNVGATAPDRTTTCDW